MSSAFYDIEVKNAEHKPVRMAEFEGQTLLIVNVASQCGFTPQYKGLEALYRKLKGQSFSVLGFPCNQFGGQEPGSEEEIKKFCSLTYDVTFPLFEKVDVNGPAASPLFEYLKSAQKGILGTEAIKWNFTKFLVSKNGEVVERFAPTTSPESLESKIQKIL